MTRHSTLYAYASLSQSLSRELGCGASGIGARAWRVRLRGRHRPVFDRAPISRVVKADARVYLRDVDVDFLADAF